MNHKKSIQKTFIFSLTKLHCAKCSRKDKAFISCIMVSAILKYLFIYSYIKIGFHKTSLYSSHTSGLIMTAIYSRIMSSCCTFKIIMTSSLLWFSSYTIYYIYDENRIFEAKHCDVMIGCIFVCVREKKEREWEIKKGHKRNCETSAQDTEQRKIAVKTVASLILQFTTFRVYWCRIHKLYLFWSILSCITRKIL